MWTRGHLARPSLSDNGKRGTKEGPNLHCRLRRQQMKTDAKDHTQQSTVAQIHQRTEPRHHHRSQRRTTRIDSPRSKQDITVSTSGGGHASGRRAETSTSRLFHDRCRHRDSAARRVKDDHKSVRQGAQTRKITLRWKSCGGVKSSQT